MPISATIQARPREVLFVLPPDFLAPPSHLAFRFPPLGPAVVAACIADEGYASRAVDLAAIVFRRPLTVDTQALTDTSRVARHLGGGDDRDLEAAIEELMRHLDGAAEGWDYIAISIDRGSQVPVAALLSRELKRRWGKRIIVGGVATHHLRVLLEQSGAAGADIVTRALTPSQIRSAFAALAQLSEHRVGPPIEPEVSPIELVRGGRRKAPSALSWPLPDFSIYDLDLYRRDPLLTAPSPQATTGIAPHHSLVLPYFFTLECQFSCAFCQTGGTQESKPVDLVVRELATLSERWGVGEFIFFDAQINLLARELAKGLLDARLDLRWSDSYRVRPSSPGDLELMARAGCASLTVGVESASDRVLKKMTKGHHAAQATEMITEAHQNEILLRVNLLTCYPGETREDLELTRAWVHENALAIDDLAPSSFYLTLDSAIGRQPERYGLKIRGPRPLRGITRFRKSPDSLIYDEIDGMTWEEREPLLEQSEELVRAAWQDGRKDLRAGGFPLPTMVTLRRHFSTKREIYELLSNEASPTPKKSSTPKSSVSVKPIPLRAHLLAPTRIPPALARTVASAFKAATVEIGRRARPGDTCHCLVVGGGGHVLFRGTVTRGPANVVHRFAIEELLTTPNREALGDTLVRILTRGAQFSTANGVLEIPSAESEPPRTLRFAIVTLELAPQPPIKVPQGVEG